MHQGFGEGKQKGKGKGNEKAGSRLYLNQGFREGFVWEKDK